MQYTSYMETFWGFFFQDLFKFSKTVSSEFWNLTDDNIYQTPTHLYFHNGMFHRFNISQT